MENQSSNQQLAQLWYDVLWLAFNGEKNDPVNGVSRWTLFCKENGFGKLDVATFAWTQSIVSVPIPEGIDDYRGHCYEQCERIPSTLPANYNRVLQLAYNIGRLMALGEFRFSTLASNYVNFAT